MQFNKMVKVKFCDCESINTGKHDPASISDLLVSTHLKRTPTCVHSLEKEGMRVLQLQHFEIHLQAQI